MKIVFVSDQFYPRSSADSEQIISSLSALGEITDTTLLSACYSYNCTKSDEIEEYYGKKCSFDLQFISHLFKNIRAIEKISFAFRSGIKLRKSKYNISYTRNIPVLIAIIFFTRIPVVFESYRPWPSRNIASKWFFNWLKKKKQLLGIVTHSSFAANSFFEAGYKSEQLLIAHNAFSRNEYPFEDKAAIRKRNNLPDDKLIVCYSGRVSKTKGVDRIFDLASEFRDVLFVVVGSEKEGEIEKQAKSFANIKIIGWLAKKDVFSFLIASDVLYIPGTAKARDKARNTVLPLKTFIYKASGVPILAPDMKDLREVLTDKENAILVEPDNTKAEIEGLRLLLNDPDLRSKIGKKAKSEMENLTWEKRAQKIHTFIHSKLGTI